MSSLPHPVRLRDLVGQTIVLAPQRVVSLETALFRDRRFQAVECLVSHDGATSSDIIFHAHVVPALSAHLGRTIRALVASEPAPHGPSAVVLRDLEVLA